MKSRIAYILSVIIITIAIGVVGVVTFWTIYPYKPMVINKEPLKVLTPEVGRGRPLTYEIDFCKNMDLQATIQKAYENDIIFPASITHPKNDEGCRVSHISQVVPYELPSGTYKMKIVFTYRVNPIREISIVTYTEYFNVTERD